MSSAEKLYDEGVANLLTAFIISAYDDYVNGGLLLKRSEYETKNGVIKLHSVNGRKPTAKEDNLIKYYTWSVKYFEDTKYGLWLMRKGNEQIAEGKHRGINRNTILKNRDIGDVVDEWAEEERS